MTSIIHFERHQSNERHQSDCAIEPHVFLVKIRCPSDDPIEIYMAIKKRTLRRDMQISKDESYERGA